MSMTSVLDLLTAACPGLAGAEQATVQVRGTEVTVLYRPTPGECRPLEVLAAVVVDTDWRTGLDLAGRFGGYCPRILILPQEPADVDWAAMDADYWGIGLIAAGRLLVQPEPFEDRVYSPAGDRFAADIHQQITTQEPAGRI